MKRKDGIFQRVGIYINILYIYKYTSGGIIYIIYIYICILMKYAHTHTQHTYACTVRCNFAT